MEWLSDATVHDLHPAIGNGPFSHFLGVTLHVNVDEHGTPDSFWGNGNPGQVCPNFQVYKNGEIHQMLPLDWQPWCQIDGNFNYAAIETAGMPNEPLTDAQLHSCAAILRAYHTHMGMVLKVADKPGQPGLITHKAGGIAWGGHDCPGAIRTAQRRTILALAATTTTTRKPPVMVKDTKMLLVKIAKHSPVYLVTGNGLLWLSSEDYTAIGKPPFHVVPEHGTFAKLPVVPGTPDPRK